MSYCAVIPNYNHTHRIREVITHLVDLGLPVIMVNDASTPEAKTFFCELEKEFDSLEVVHHEQNQGKGGAVQTGLRRAYRKGYEFALQVDADGQHSLADAERLLRTSKEHPGAVISGRPLFDDSIPKIRFLSRYITHFWVVIETLSLMLKDTMCGFRVYPLAPTVALLQSVNMGRRMDFDIEIMVRLYWRGLRFIFLPTKVIYPEDGSSHFRPLQDNVLISWLHTRLFFGMLLRIPYLIARHFGK